MDVAVMVTSYEPVTVTGAVNVAVVFVDMKVPAGLGAPAPGVKTHVTPSLLVSLGTLAVTVTVPPATICVAVGCSTTLLKSDGVPAQPATPRAAKTNRLRTNENAVRLPMDNPPRPCPAVVLTPYPLDHKNEPERGTKTGGISV